jgi:hypothetical protein
VRCPRERSSADSRPLSASVGRFEDQQDANDDQVRGHDVVEEARDGEDQDAKADGDDARDQPALLRGGVGEYYEGTHVASCLPAREEGKLRA